jgi:hypothetical protein
MNTDTVTNTDTVADTLEKPLLINDEHMHKYGQVKKMLAHEQIPPEHQVAYELAMITLTSKQCNEPYEKLLSDCLGLVNCEKKHGWDGVDKKENPTEFYEYKPSSLTKSPTGTINDDSEAKIAKCEVLTKTEGQKGWLILAGINKAEFNFQVIYKFPLEIYTEDRRKYLAKTMEKNKAHLGQKQTRITYAINVKKSIELCKQFNKVYYVYKTLF